MKIYWYLVIVGVLLLPQSAPLGSKGYFKYIPIQLIQKSRYGLITRSYDLFFTLVVYKILY